MNTLKVGTFVIRGNMKDGYWTKDTDTFNNWGTAWNATTNSNWKTRQEACEYAHRCHEFKIGRRTSI